MDTTYKTNRYKMPLFVITGVNTLNRTFYIGFAFIHKEKITTYEWVLQQLKELYQELHLSPPEIILTDHEKALIGGIRLVFTDTVLLLCLWHIQNNVASKCKHHFNQDDWEAFSKEFTAICYKQSESDFNDAWDDLQQNCTAKAVLAVIYVQDYVIPYKQQFVKYWTNKYRHFNNATTGRCEGAHGKIKDELGVSTGDLNIVVDVIDRVLRNEHMNFVDELADDKIRFQFHFQIDMFRDLKGLVSSEALKQLLN